jgi:hypothetical protein
VSDLKLGNLDSRVIREGLLKRRERDGRGERKGVRLYLQCQDKKIRGYNLSTLNTLCIERMAMTSVL